jgi:GNAT superfamily N-acetyltransferase
MNCSDDVLAAADRNMLEAWRAVIAAAPTPGDEAGDHVVMLSSGLPIPLFNPAFVTGQPADPAAMVAAVIDHYASVGAPFVLYFRDETVDGMPDPCQTAGLVEHWQPPLMVLDPVPETIPDGPADLVVRRVTHADLEAYLTTLAVGFGMPLDLALEAFGPTLLDHEGFTALLGTVAGKPVATSGQFVSSGVGGVYNVATVPDARGRGIGAAMTWAAAAVGAEAGARCSILQASKEGEPVYTRMGYATPSRYRQFEGPPPAG